jgi:hypothetical protein
MSESTSWLSSRRLQHFLRCVIAVGIPMSLLGAWYAMEHEDIYSEVMFLALALVFGQLATIIGGEVTPESSLLG